MTAFDADARNGCSVRRCRSRQLRPLPAPAATARAARVTIPPRRPSRPQPGIDATMQWIGTPAELTAQLATAPARVGLDTEFVRERTWWPQLALVQLAIDSGDGTTILIVDPLVPGMGDALTPMLADPSVLKIMHSASEDLVALKH